MLQKSIQIKFLKLHAVLILLCINTPAFSDNLDIFLPTASRFVAGTIDEGAWSVSLGFMKEVKDFRLQYEPSTMDSEHITDYARYSMDLTAYVSYGLTEQIEIELGSEKGSYLAFKYEPGKKTGLSVRHSVIAAWLQNEHEGHAGAVIQEGDDCGWFDIFCWMFSSHEPTIYEYNYKADIDGLLLGYFIGYQFNDRIMTYAGVTYTAYSIDYYLDDNTVADIDQSLSLNTDVLALWIGTKIRVGKNNNKFLSAGYDFYKDSFKHDGDLTGRLNFAVHLLY